MAADTQVLETLKKAGKPLKSAEIAELAKIDKAEVDKAIKALKKEGAVVSPKACYYTVA
ncbi:MarR family transcriptional regulator [Spirochaetia bacterium]|nr:MarR family transcriptional regulator [Spirochaetia bacterium]